MSACQPAWWLLLPFYLSICIQTGPFPEQISAKMILHQETTVWPHPSGFYSSWSHGQKSSKGPCKHGNHREEAPTGCSSWSTNPDKASKKAWAEPEMLQKKTLRSLPGPGYIWPTAWICVNGIQKISWTSLHFLREKNYHATNQIDPAGMLPNLYALIKINNYFPKHSYGSISTERSSSGMCEKYTASFSHSLL